MNDKTKFIIEATAVTLAAIWAASELALGLALGLFAIAFGRLLLYAQPGDPASIKVSLRLALAAIVIFLFASLFNEWIMSIGLLVIGDRKGSLMIWRLFVLVDWWIILRGIRERYQLL